MHAASITSHRPEPAALSSLTPTGTAGGQSRAGSADLESSPVMSEARGPRDGRREKQQAPAYPGTAHSRTTFTQRQRSRDTGKGRVPLAPLSSSTVPCALHSPPCPATCHLLSPSAGCSRCFLPFAFREVFHWRVGCPYAPSSQPRGPLQSQEHHPGGKEFRA